MFGGGQVIILMCIVGVIVGMPLSAVFLATNEYVVGGMASMEVDGAAADAAEFAGEYESAVRDAAAAQAAGDDWTAAVAHGRAGVAAGDAADEWSDMDEKIGAGYYIKYGGDAAADAVKMAASAEAGWRTMEAEAFGLAAGAAVDAGWERAAAVLARNAADAQERADELYIDALLFAESLRASEAVYMPAEHGMRP